MIESVTVLPDGVTAVRLAGVEIPVVLKLGQTIRWLKTSVVVEDDSATTVIMSWVEH